MNSLRNIVLVALMALGTPSLQGKSPAAPGGTESSAPWISLFNGRDLTGWSPKITGHRFGENYRNTFRVEDGILKVCYDQYEQFDNSFGHLFFESSFSHYRLRIEYRFVGEQVKGGPGWAFRNSGVMLHCQPPQTMTQEQDFPISIEGQMLGGNGKDKRPTANVCTPGTHIVMDGLLVKRHCNNSTSKTFHGDQWVTMEVEVRGNGTIKHFVNGELVLTYEKPQYDPSDKQAKSLMKDDNPLIAEGYISLQAESHPVEFRKVEIRLLSE